MLWEGYTWLLRLFRFWGVHVCNTTLSWLPLALQQGPFHFLSPQWPPVRRGPTQLRRGQVSGGPSAPGAGEWW